MSLRQRSPTWGRWQKRLPVRSRPSRAARRARRPLSRGQTLLYSTQEVILAQSQKIILAQSQKIILAQSQTILLAQSQTILLAEYGRQQNGPCVPSNKRKKARVEV